MVFARQHVAECKPNYAEYVRQILPGSGGAARSVRHFVTCIPYKCGDIPYGR